jgi:hypothetical protein
MSSRLALRLAVACCWCAVAPAAAVYTCADADDCELLGTCVDGACVCTSGFSGPSCGVLNLAPAKRATMVQWPVAADVAAGTVSGWGFSPVYDAADGKWHAVACTACGWDGVLKPGGGTSITVHLVSDVPDAGWTLAAMFTPPTTFNPTLLRTADGGYALYFRANALDLTPLCGGNGSNPSPELLNGSYVPASALSPDPTGEGATNIYVAAAASMYGPWAVSRVNITGAGAVHKSNPSVVALADGRYLMAYRYNPPGGERNAVAVADDFRGPFVNVANLTQGPGGDEDPFVWQADDGSVHMLYHNGPAGYHAFSRNGTCEWRSSPTGAHAFSLHVDVDDGSTLVLSRRERPFLTFASPERPHGAPTFLFNGAQLADKNGSALSFVQPFVSSP